MKRRICDKDCLNCRFDDCINDEMDAQDYQESDRRDKLCQSEAKRKMRAKNKAAYEKRRADKLAYARDYYQKHKEEAMEYQRRYRADEANRKRANAVRRKWERRNRGLYGQKQKILRTKRLRLGLTQKEVAMIIGVTPSCIGQWERGIQPCKVEAVLKKIYDGASGMQ